MQLHYAAGRGDLEAVKRQLARGIAIEARDKQYGLTPLMFAASGWRADVSMLEFLIGQGADVNAVGLLMEETPLWLAAKNESVEKVRYLLDAGANPQFKNSIGLTPLMTDTPPPVEIIKILLEAGVDPNTDYANGDTAISTAAYYGEMAAVQALLDGGAKSLPLGWTKLMRAVALGTVEEVAELLKAGDDLHERSSVGWTPWHMSLHIGSLPKAQLLLDAGASMDDVSQFGRTSLMHAVARDNADILEWLISLGADVNDPDNRGLTPLHVAAQTGAVGCVEMLIASEAIINAVDQDESQPIDVASNIEVVRLLVDAGADINYVNGYAYGLQGMCLLKRTAQDGDVDFVRELLEMGASTEATRTGDTPLHAAVKTDQLEVVRILLESGADPNAQDTDERPVLHFAQSLEAVQLLLGAGADPNLADQLGQDALQAHEDTEILELLVQYGASVNPEDTSYGTPLTRAAEDGDLERLRFLIASGADIEATPNWGQTALMGAAAHGSIECLKLLLESGADIHAVDENGRNALFYAAAPEGFLLSRLAADGGVAARAKLAADEEDDDGARAAVLEAVESDSVDAMQILLDAGIDIDDLDKRGMTALTLAASCGRAARVGFLLDHGAEADFKDRQRSIFHPFGMTLMDNARAHPKGPQRDEIIALVEAKTRGKR